MKSPTLLSLMVFIAAISLFHQGVTPVLADQQPLSNEVVGVYEITDLETKEGDILVATKESGITRASQPYDSRLFGVAQNSGTIVYRRLDGKGQGIARNGTAVVNVVDTNGAIAAGDYVTSSQTPGVGQKATGSGYVIGVALTPSSASTGQVVVSLRIEYAEIDRARSFGRLLDALSSTLFRNIQDPNKFTQIIKYIAAALAILASLALGFITFSRSIPKAVEAIGRNPLAANTIRFSLILNVILTVLIAAIGVIAAAIIIKI